MRVDREGREGRENREGRNQRGGEENLAPIAGILDIQETTRSYVPRLPARPNDVYVTLGNVRRQPRAPVIGRAGAARLPREGERQRQKSLVRVDSVNGMTIEQACAPRICKLMVYSLRQAWRPRQLHAARHRPGRPVRAVSVARLPPKAGAIIQQMAKAIEQNNPRGAPHGRPGGRAPEEVTDMRSDRQYRSTSTVPPRSHDRCRACD